MLPRSRRLGISALRQRHPAPCYGEGRASTLWSECIDPRDPCRDAVKEPSAAVTSQDDRSFDWYVSCGSEKRHE